MTNFWPNVSNSPCCLCVFLHFCTFESLYFFAFIYFCILCFERLDLLAQKVIAVLCQMDNFQIQLQSFSRKFKCWLPFSPSFKSKEITNISIPSQHVNSLFKIVDNCDVQDLFIFNLFRANIQFASNKQWELCKQGYQVAAINSMRWIISG